LNGNGTVTFTPNANFNGAANFSYTATDGLATSNTATVTVNVAALNDAPVISLSAIIAEVPIPDPLPAGSDAAAQNYLAPAISNDGRWVVFFSSETLPTDGDNNGPTVGDVFLYDRLTNTTKVLTDNAHIPSRPAGEHYSGFSISADGNVA